MLKMRSLIVLSTIFFTLLVATSLLSAGAQVPADRPLMKVDVKQYHLTAGDENEIVVSVTNVGDADAYNVKASLTVPATLQGISVVEGSLQVFDEIKAGRTKTVRPVLYVARDCPLGAYSLTLTLEYVCGYRTYVDSVEVGIVVDAVKPTKFILDVDVEDYNVTAGAENEIGIILTNTGDEAISDVKAVLASTTPGIVVLNESSYLFDELDVGEKIKFTPVLGISRSVALGAYSLTVSLEYKDSMGVTYRDSVAIGIFVNSVRSRRLAFTAEVENYNLTAGVANKVKVVLTNDGDASVHDVNVLLSSTSPQITVLSGVSSTFDSIAPGQSVYFMPTLGVSRTTPLGAYSLTLTLSYKDSDGVSHVDSLVIGVFVSSVLSYKPAFKAEVKEYRVKAGVENEIVVLITNVGDTPVYEVDAQLTSTNPNIIVLKGASGTFGLIGLNETVQFSPTIGIARATPLGVYPLTLTLKYKDPDGVSHVDSLVVGVFVDSVEQADRTTIAVQRFQVTPPEVHPGGELTVKATLKNLGADAYDVQAELMISPNVPFVPLGPTLVFVGDLSSGETEEVVYNLRVSGDAKARSYTVQLVVSYYDVYNQPGSITETVSIDVHSITDLRLINVEPSTIVVHPGETATVTADLLLIGTETIDFAQVEVVEGNSSDPFAATAGSYEYIGSVDPDSPVTFDLEFAVNSNATPGSYKLPIKVTYWDEYRRVHQTMIKLPVVVQELARKSEEATPTIWDSLWRFIRTLFGIRP